jgi:hypothetical protein
MSSYYVKMRHNFRTMVKGSQSFGLTGTGPMPTDDLTSPTRDRVFLAQLQKADSPALDAEIPFTANVVGEQTSRSSNEIIFRGKPS